MAAENPKKAPFQALFCTLLGSFLNFCHLCKPRSENQFLECPTFVIRTQLFEVSALPDSPVQSPDLQQFLIQEF
jgi:hypothetical protein